MSDADRPSAVTLVDILDVPEEDDLLVRLDSEPEPIGPWVVDWVMGRSAHATVYACHNRNAPRIKAAIKVPAHGLGDDSEAERRLLEEAKLGVRLDHPHIVAVRNLVLDHRPPYLEMALVDGQDLQEVLTAGALPQPQLLSVAAGLVSAVGALQAAGVHHRDLKPGNVILGPSGPVLIDFGLAVVAGDAGRPLDGVQGTVGYLPPEWQPDGVVDGGAWDRYALGVVLFECAAGRPADPVDPIRTRLEQLFAIQARVADRDHLDPGPSVRPALRELVRRLTARDPADRALDLDSAATALRSWADGSPSGETELLALLGDAASGGEEALGSPDVTAGPPLESSVLESSDLKSSVLESPDPDRSGLEETAQSPVAGVPAGPTASPARWAGVVVASVASVVVLALLWAYFGQSPQLGPGTVAVRLALDVVPAAGPLPVDCRLDGQPIEPSQSPVLTPGTHQLTARLGESCGTGALPAWCAEVQETVTVAEGARSHILHTLFLPAVPTHPVVVEVDGSLPSRMRVDRLPWTDCTDTTCTLSAHPGPSRVLTVQAGRCPDTPCAGDCPPECVEQSVVVELGFEQTEPVTIRLELAPIARPSKSPELTPQPDVSAGLGPVITVGAFLRWLERHPAHQPGGAAAKADADARYLQGWVGLEPRHRRTGAPLPRGVPVDGVSPKVFTAYCAGREGVAWVDDGPPKTAGQDFELRRTAAGWVALNSAGKAAPVLDATRSLQHFTVRCRR